MVACAERKKKAGLELCSEAFIIVEKHYEYI